MVAGAAAGAATGATAFQASEHSEERDTKRVQGALAGAAVGTAAGGINEAVTAIKNFFPRAIEKAKQLHASVLQRGLELQDRTGVSFKLSQLVQDPSIEELEAFARQSAAGERLARGLEDLQPKQLLDHFEKLAGPTQSGAFGMRTKAAFQSVMGDVKAGTGLLGARKMQAAKDFAAAQQAGGLIPVSNFLSKIDEIVHENTLAGAGRTERALAGELSALKKDILNRANGELKPLELQKRLEAWGRAAKGTGKIFSDKVDRAAEFGPSRALFAALNDDLDNAIKLGGSGAAELRTARDNYALATASINKVRDSALGRMFGGTKDLSLEAIEGKMLSMAPSEIKGVMGILSKEDPTIAEGLQKFWVQRWVESARIPGQAGAIEFAPAKLLDMFTGNKHVAGHGATNREVFDAVFSDPAMKKQVRDGLEAVQFMMVNNTRTSGKTVTRLRNLAHMVASRDPGFAARFAAELFAPKMITQYVLSKDGVQALKTLAHNPNNARAAAVLMKIGEVGLRSEPTTP